MPLTYFIQKLLDSITRKEFLLLIGILSMFVIFAPTVFLLEIFNDSGKGFMNMLTIYLIGRYFATYGFPKFIISRNLIIIPLLTLLIFGLNEILSWLGYSQIFGRDNNLLIIILAISIFYTALEHPVHYNAYINRIATYVMPIYIIHMNLKYFVCYHFKTYTSLPILLQIINSIVILFILSIFVEYLRSIIFSRWFEKLNNTLNRFIHYYLFKHYRLLNDVDIKKAII